LPGLWFSACELYALLAAHKLLGDLEPGILSSHVAPLQARLSALLESSGHSASEITQRVRLRVRLIKILANRATFSNLMPRIAVANPTVNERGVDCRHWRNKWLKLLQRMCL